MKLNPLPALPEAKTDLKLDSLSKNDRAPSSKKFDDLFSRVKESKTERPEPDDQDTKKTTKRQNLPENEEPRPESEHVKIQQPQQKEEAQTTPQAKPEVKAKPSLEAINKPLTPQIIPDLQIAPIHPETTEVAECTTGKTPTAQGDEIDEIAPKIETKTDSAACIPLIILETPIVTPQLPQKNLGDVQAENKPDLVESIVGEVQQSGRDTSKNTAQLLAMKETNERSVVANLAQSMVENEEQAATLKQADPLLGEVREGINSLKTIATRPTPHIITPTTKIVSTETLDFDQVVFHMTKGLKEQLPSISLQLRPPNLGRMDIDLHFDPRDHFFAVIGVEKRETLDLLLRDQAALEHSLKEAGIQLGSNALQFHFQGDTSWGNSQGFSQNQPSFSQRETVESIQEMGRWTSISARGRLNILV